MLRQDQKGDRVGFQDDLNDIARQNGANLASRSEHRAQADSHRQATSRRIQELLTESGRFLADYPQLGTQLIAYDSASENKFFGSPKFTPLGRSWRFILIALTEHGEMYDGSMEVEVGKKGYGFQRLSKYATSNGEREGSRISWVKLGTRPVSYAPDSLAVILESDWTKSTMYGSDVPHRYFTSSKFPGQVKHSAFGIFSDGRPALVTYSSSDGHTWYAEDLERYLKASINSILANAVNKTYRGT